MPDAARLWLAGDETAYPAMARILAAMQPGATAQVWMIGRLGDYPMPRGPAITCTHVPDASGRLADLLRSHPPLPTDYIWIAAEKSVVSALRPIVLDDLRHDPALTHLTAYWSV